MFALTVSQAAHATRAMMLLAANRAIEATNIAKGLVAETPNAADAHHLLALCQSAAGMTEEADSAFQSALRLIPKQPMFLENYAKFLRQHGRLFQAMKMREILAAGNANLKNTLAMGQAALDAKKAELAVKAFRLACTLSPSNPSAYLGLSTAWQMLGDLSLADEAIQRSLALEDNATNWSALAFIQRLSGRPELAIDSYRKALVFEPQRLDIKDGLSGAMIDALDVSSALRNAEALVLESPDCAPAFTTLANLRFMYDREDAFSAPGSRFEKATLAAPTNLDLQLAWLRFLLETKQSSRALDAVRSARLRFDAPLLGVFEANALEQLENGQQAAALYAVADRHFGGHDVAFLNTYVRHLLKRGDVQLAAQKAEIAIELDPDSQESWAYQATIWRLLQDAREYWLCDYDRLVEQMTLQVADGDGEYSNLLRHLRSYLDEIHLAQHEPAAQSVRGGLQTPGVLFGRNVEPIQILERIVKRTLEHWVAKLPVDAKHPFLRRKSQVLRFGGSWSIKLRKSGTHANHFHNQGWISSAFYVSLPPAVTDSSEHAGAIQFGQPPIELGLALSPRRIIKPLVGHLALFPSYLWHGTVPFDDQDPRVSIAFDVIPVPAGLLNY
jgi:Tfp pilus assembly protein PilF